MTHPNADDPTPYTAISYAVADGIATVTLNRPEARNGYTRAMADEAEQAFKTADRDPGVRVVVFTGAGRDFSVGADLSGGGFDLAPETAAAETAEPYDWQEPAGRCSKTIFAMNKPVIAALRGAAVASSRRAARSGTCPDWWAWPGQRIG